MAVDLVNLLKHSDVVLLCEPLGELLEDKSSGVLVGAAFDSFQLFVGGRSQGVFPGG